MITDLRNPTLKQRHWDQIYAVLEHSFTNEDPLTLGKLVDINAFKHAESLQEISGQASSEASLEAILKKVCRFNPLPHRKILDLSKLKAFTDDNFKVAQMVQFYFHMVENFVGKGENAGYQHFLLFPQCFLKVSFSGASKVGIVW